MVSDPPVFDRAGAKRAGYSDAEIDAFLAKQGGASPEYERPRAAPIRRRSLAEIADTALGVSDDPLKPKSARIASESTQTRATTPTVTGLRNDWIDAARQVGQAATFGFADELEAGARAPFDPRTYREIRDDIRSTDANFARENPGAAVALNVAGGVASGSGLLKAGKALPSLARMLQFTGLTPKATATASTARRIAQGVRAGGAAGAVTGAGTAKEMRDVPGGVVAGGFLGSATGGLLSGATELMRGTRNVLGAVGQGDEPAGAIRRAIRAESPEDAGVQRVMRTIGRSGKTLDDVGAASLAADDPDMLAEVIGARGVRQLRTANSIGDAAPDQIERALTERARNEVGRVRGAVTREIGDAVDDQAYIAGKKLEAQTTAGPLYEQAVTGRKLTDVRVVDLLDLPEARDAYDDAVRLAKNDGVVMPKASQVARGAKPKPTGDDVPLRGGSRVDALDEADLASMSQEQLRSVRRQATPLSKLSDKELDTELMYLRQAQGADEAKAAFRESQDFAEYLSQKSIGLDEDARGMMSQLGYTDPNDFNLVTREAALAEKMARERAPKIAAVEKEMARRQAAFGDVPADAVTAPSPSVRARDAVTLPDEADAATLPTLDAKHVQYWKFALDDRIRALEGKPGGAASTRMRQLIAQRDAVDNLLYEHAEGWGAAQQTYAKPMQESDAFAEGVKRGRTLQPADADAMLTAPNARERSRGVANTIVEDLDRLGDGAAGPVRNPAQTVMGSAQSRARVKVATGGDAEKQRRIEQAAENAARRLRTKNEVLGGSKTFDKFADAAAEGVDMTEIVRSASNPLAAVGRAVGKGVDAVGRQAMGKTMDETAKLLMAGAPGQLTRAEVLARLKRMEPALLMQLQKQLANRAVAGSFVARAALDGSAR